MDIEVSVEKISPAKAEKMLNTNCSNRTLREGIVEKYADDMRKGQWTKCIAPIAFYEDGDVADGQHRLWAIIESGETHEFMVVRGLDRESGLNIDVGLPRSLVDNARISGVNEHLSNRIIAVARVVATGQRGSRSPKGVSNAVKLAYVDKYNECVRWAIENAPAGRTFSHSLVLGAMARAYMVEEDKARLARFGEVLSKGFMADERDSAAIAMRNYLMVAAKTGFSHQDVWQDTFLKTQNAIKHFMRSKRLTQIKSVREEAYPLPTAKVTKLKKKAA
jgi:hypothetical protein